MAYADLIELDQLGAGAAATIWWQSAARRYDDYEFHGVYRAIYNFCVVDMSNFYLDIIKDRLYCDGADALARRSRPDAPCIRSWTAWPACMAPILAFTCEEIWAAMPHSQGGRR